MSLLPIDWFIIAGYLILSLGIGLYFKKKGERSLQDYFLGGSNLPWYIAGLSMVATTFAADTPLAVADLVSESGISGNWLWWNFLLGGLLTVFFFAKLWRRSGVLTEIALIELRYSGKTAAFLRGFKAIYFGIILNALIIGWVSNAMISIFEVFFDIERSYAILYTLLSIAFVAFYSSLSGLKGIVFTDVIQFFVALGGCIVLAVILVRESGGMLAMKEALPKGTLDFFPDINSSGGGIGTSLSIGIGAFLARISMQWWASWYPGAEPGGGGYIVQRMLSTKNENHSLYATLFFQIAHYCIRPWPWIITGLCLLVLYPTTDGQTAYVMAMRDYLPAGLKGLLLIAFFSAFMSTISTQLNWGASYLVNDFYTRFIRKEESEKRLVLVSRLSTIFLTLLSVFVAAMFDSVKDVWDFIIECGAGMGLVLILRWYWWRINAWSEIVATFGSIIFFAIAKLVLNLAFPESFFFIVGCTTVSWVLATFISAPERTDVLVAFYKKVKPQGFWAPVTKAGNISVEKSSMTSLLICWISAIIMTYGVLIGLGKLLLLEYNTSLIYAICSLFALIVLRHFVKKTTIL